MCEQHRLRPLQVRVAGQVGVAGADGAIEEHSLQFVETPGDAEQFTLAPQAQVGRHLIVTAPGRVELAARRSGQLGHAAFDGGVDVFVTLDEDELAGLDLDGGLLERFQYRIPLCSGEETDAGEPTYVRLRAVDVVAPHDAVEGQADRVRHQRLGRATGKTAVPQGSGVGCVENVLVGVVGVGHVSPVRRSRVVGQPTALRRDRPTRT